MQPILITFLEKSKYCNSLEELSVLAEMLFKSIGCPLWAYQTASENIMEKPEPILVHNYSNSWENYYVSNHCSEVDPVITRGSDLTTPFKWSDIGNAYDLNKNEQNFMHVAADYGMQDGIAIPIIGANGRSSMLSLATDTYSDEFSQILTSHSSEIIALAFAFHSIAKDFIKDNNLVIRSAELTAREQECLLWTAKGKSAWEIGQILSITERTVVFHIENAKNKFGVTSKFHLVVKAISEGYIKI